MTEIHLTEEDRAFVEDLVGNGIYKDADAVVAAGLRLLGSDEGKFVELQRLIQEGLDDVEAGRVVSFDNADDMTAHILEMAKERKNAVAPARNIPAGAGRSSRGS
jgi:antitoxin ParD1/3/4